MTTDAQHIHDEAIIIDAVCPLLADHNFVSEYQKGGITAVAPTVGSRGTAAETFASIAAWHKTLRHRNDLVLVRTAADIREAKRSGKTGIIMHFQGADPIEGNLDFLDAYKLLGVNVIQLTYNIKNRVGDGCEERTDAGLSRFGVQAIERMNELKIVVDVSHTGLKTSLEAIEHSAQPVILSHANPRAVHPVLRNAPDELLKAIAGNKGTIGVVGFPGFVSSNNPPTLDDFIDHISYLSDLVGVDHVTLGIDYYTAQWPYMSDDASKKRYEELVAINAWSSQSYPRPPHVYPKGIETPDKLLALTEALLRRGFFAEDVKKIYGENLMRVYETVWGS